MNKLPAPFLLLISLLSLHCGVTHPVRTLPEGEMQISASLGGPLIPFAGTTIPVPYANIGIARGVSEDITVTADVHALMAALGNTGVDAGATMRIMSEEGWQPELVGKTELYLFSDLNDLSNVRAFPRLSVTASYAAGTLLAYGGTDCVVQFSGENRIFVSPYAGVQIPLSGSWAMLTELKWMAANIDTRHGVFEGHASLGGHGNVGLFFGVTYAL